MRPFLGDTWAFDRLRRLRDVPEPLVAVADPVAPGAPVALTEAGRAALAGTLDHVARNGVDRWIGGVRLEVRAVAWRWDEGLERVAAA